MLPTIKIQGVEMYDISGIVTANRYTRTKTVGFTYHHSVAQTSFPDRNFNGTTMDEEIEHIKVINTFHVQQGYGGFGYNACGFESGRVYAVGNGTGARAHVANRNHELEGFCMIGTFTSADVPIGIKLAAGQWLVAKFRQHGLRQVHGHREDATAGWGTACPGDGGMRALPDILRIATVIHRGLPL
jgi:hypothetical protein